MSTETPFSSVRSCLRSGVNSSWLLGGRLREALGFRGQHDDGVRVQEDHGRLRRDLLFEALRSFASSSAVSSRHSSRTSQASAGTTGLKMSPLIHAFPRSELKRLFLGLRSTGTILATGLPRFVMMNVSRRSATRSMSSR